MKIYLQGVAIGSLVGSSLIVLGVSLLPALAVRIGLQLMWHLCSID